MYYYFNDEITEESVNSLVDKLQQYDEETNLWFATNGGEATAMRFLIRYFNSIKDRLTITITDRLLSAGTEILIDFKGKVILDKELDCVLFHLGDRESYSFRKDSTYHDAKIIIEQDRKNNIKFAEKIKKKGLLTNKQIKDFLKGKDVVVYQKQFKKWRL